MQFSQFLKTFRIFANTMVGEVSGSLWVDRAIVGQLITLVYSAAPVPNVALGNAFVMTITDGNAVVVGAPTNPPPAGFSERISLTLVNAAGAPHGAITWNAIYKTSASPFPAIANGFNRTIEFIWNGTNWVEVNAAADVTN